MSARNKKQGQSDREQIFANSDDEVSNVQIVYQTSPDLVADKSADHAACSTEQRSGN